MSGEILGYPCPIIGYHFNKLTDADVVRKAFWNSSIKLVPQSLSARSHHYSCEDHNGYSRILDLKFAHEIKKMLKGEGLLKEAFVPLAEAHNYHFSRIAAPLSKDPI
jgi:hypothetical protein